MFYVPMGRKDIKKLQEEVLTFAKLLLQCGGELILLLVEEQDIKLKVSIGVWSMYRNGGKEGLF